MPPPDPEVPPAKRTPNRQPSPATRPHADASRAQECANAIEHGITLPELAMTVHTHPTLCEALDEAFKGGMGRAAH